MCWIQTAKVGDKVVCVYGDWTTYQRQAAVEFGLTLPEGGATYTLRTIGEVVPGHVHVRLVEIVNPILDYELKGRIEQAFDHVMFRPVRVTDIGIFTALLDTAPAKVEEDA